MSAAEDPSSTPAVPEFTRVIWTSRRRGWLAREATESDAAGDLVVRDNQLLVLVGEIRFFDS
jgi:hypothetical protein